MKRHLLIDRTLTWQLLYPSLGSDVPSDDRVLDFVDLCRMYEAVYIEEHGASGLERTLAQRRAQLPAVIPVQSSVDLQLSAEDKRSLEAVIATPGDEVREALRRFQHEKGGRPRPHDEVLKYAFRLILLAFQLDADLLCWSPRTEILRGLLEVTGPDASSIAIGEYLRVEGSVSKLIPSCRGSIGVLLRSADPSALAAAEQPQLDRPGQPRTILFLAASPSGVDRLALDREAHAIQAELERVGRRDCFRFETRWAVEPLDLLRTLVALKPTVVHFSGHGSAGGGGESSADRARDVTGDFAAIVAHSHQGGGLLFQTSQGHGQLVTTAALARALRAAGASVKLVVLNACYTDVQAEALVAHVPCVVGMQGPIDDNAAQGFAIGFYLGLGEAKSIAAACELGRTALDVLGLSGADRPQLKVRAGIDASALVLAW